MCQPRLLVSSPDRLTVNSSKACWRWTLLTDLDILQYLPTCRKKITSSPSPVPQPRGSFGAPQMASQPVSSIFLSSLPPFGTWRAPGLSLMLSSHLFFCLPCLLPPFTVPHEMGLARPDERETCTYHCSWRLFTTVRRLSCSLIACWTWEQTRW